MTGRKSKQLGIPSLECYCGDHVFAYPHHDALEEWKRLSSTTIRGMLVKKGLLSEHPPRPLPHVILVSRDDREAFTWRRWRVFPSPRGKLAKFEVKSRIVSKALHRMLMPEAKRISFANNDGCDCRRENLVGK